MKTKKRKPLTREEALKDTSSMSAPFAWEIEGEDENTILIYNKDKAVEVKKNRDTN